MNIKDFIAKVEWEGGIDGAFIGYGLNPDRIKTDKTFTAVEKTHLVSLVSAYKLAYDQLDSFLQDFGYGNPEDEEYDIVEEDESEED